MQVYDIKVQKNDVVILGSDGIWDNLFEQQVIEIVDSVHTAGGGPEVWSLSRLHLQVLSLIFVNSWSLFIYFLVGSCCTWFVNTVCNWWIWDSITRWCIMNFTVNSFLLCWFYLVFFTLSLENDYVFFVVEFLSEISHNHTCSISGGI